MLGWPVPAEESTLSSSKTLPFGKLTWHCDDIVLGVTCKERMGFGGSRAGHQSGVSSCSVPRAFLSY